MDECHNYGIIGGCDEHCPVLMRGDCTLQEDECKFLYIKVLGNHDWKYSEAFGGEEGRISPIFVDCMCSNCGHVALVSECGIEWETDDNSNTYQIHICPLCSDVMGEYLTEKDAIAFRENRKRRNWEIVCQEYRTIIII